MQEHNPVSFKGVLFLDGKVVLLKNERDEWELPGGRRSEGEEPTECVHREFLEETGLPVQLGPVLNVWLYYGEKKETLIVTFGCWSQLTGEAQLERSDEHKEIGMFSLSELDNLSLPQGYRDSIHLWYADPRYDKVSL